MIDILRRFYEEYRHLLLVLFLVLLGNLLFWILLNAPARIHASGLAKDSEKAETALTEALREYGLALLEARLYAHTEQSIEALHRLTLRTNPERFPVVDAKIKELAQKFRPHSISNDWVVLKNERLEQLRLSFNLKGGYDNLRRFLTEIEQARDQDGADLFFAIESVGLTDSTDTGSELNLSISVATYFSRADLAVEDRAGAARGGRGKSGR